MRMLQGPLRAGISLTLVLTGCGDPVPDPHPDAHATLDAATAHDAGTPARDAFVPREDASTPPTDGRTPPADSGSSAPPDGPGPYTVAESSMPIDGGTAVAFVPSIDTGTRAPLVVFSHGFQLATSNYAMLAERLASHGFVVVGVDTGGGGFGGGTSNVDERDAAIAAIDWATSDAPFASSVDASRIGVGGHSRGGKVAVMAAAADPRVRAALLLDPVNGCGPGASYSADCPDVTGDAFAGALAIPVGVMGETNNASGGFMPCAPADQNYLTIYAALARAPWAVSWTFTGADHMDFTDDGGGFAGSFCPDGPGDDAQIRAAVRTLAVAFARRHLRGEAAMDAWLGGASLPAGITVEGP